jgi:hypothetical protein
MLCVCDVNVCLAPLLPVVGTTLEYYCDSTQVHASDSESVFDHITRFQNIDVQDRALVKWQPTTFSSVRTGKKAGGYEKLRNLSSTGRRIYCALPVDF